MFFFVIILGQVRLTKVRSAPLGLVPRRHSAPQRLEIENPNPLSFFLKNKGRSQSSVILQKCYILTNIVVSKVSWFQNSCATKKGVERENLCMTKGVFQSVLYCVLIYDLVDLVNFVSFTMQIWDLVDFKYVLSIFSVVLCIFQVTLG